MICGLADLFCLCEEFDNTTSVLTNAVIQCEFRTRLPSLILLTNKFDLSVGAE